MGGNPISFNIHATQMIYPSPEVEWRPNAVILAPMTTYHYGLIASPVIHFPINAPILFTNPNTLYPEILAEILRLSPTGNVVPAKVIIVGPISAAVETQLARAGLPTVRIVGNDPFTAAAEAMEFRYKYPPDSMEGMENIMVVPADSPVIYPHAAYYSAHMGVPILFCYKDRLPEVTKQKLTKYRDKNVFIIADENMVTERVIEEIRQVTAGKVDWIGGRTHTESAVNFSKYHSETGHFGWNINKRDGWSFCFGTMQNWVECQSACIFAHLAKHTPLLYVDPGKVPEITSNYVLSLNPYEVHPPKPPFMHGYILGGFEAISAHTQLELESILTKKAAENDDRMMTQRNWADQRFIDPLLR
jgi:hypothetical protein